MAAALRPRPILVVPIDWMDIAGARRASPSACPLARATQRYADALRDPLDAATVTVNNVTARVRRYGVHHHYTLTHGAQRFVDAVDSRRGVGPTVVVLTHSRWCPACRRDIAS